MSPVLRVAGYTLSVLLHVGAAALVLAWSVPDWTQPLFVDLVEPPGTPMTEAPRASQGPTGNAAPRFLHQGAAPPAARSGATRVAAAPSGDQATPSGSIAQPEPQAMVASPSPPTPEPAATDPPPVSTPSASTRPTASPAGGRVVASEPGAAGAAGAGSGRSLVGTDAGTTGPPGAALALAAPGGEPGGPGPEYGPYLRRFRERIASALVYPLAAQRQGVAGTVELFVRLEASGRVSDVRVVRSSSHVILDDAAIETIRRVGPLPFPDSLPRRPLLIRVPLVFELR